MDIWALGILLYLMVTGAMPFKGATVAELKNAILDGHFAMPDYLSAHCADLIASILKRKSEWRLTLQQVNDQTFELLHFYCNKNAIIAINFEKKVRMETDI